MRFAVLAVLLSARVAAAGAGFSDHEWAEREAITARQLAREGDCARALAMEPHIRALDPAVADYAYANNPFLAACRDGAPLPVGVDVGPPSLRASVQGLVVPRAACDDGVYFEPSLLAGASDTSPKVDPLNRLALGLLIRDCNAEHRSTTQARLGSTLHVGGPGHAGVGFEVEVNEPTSPSTRLGVRLGYEWEDQSRTLATAGVRLHVSDTMYVQLDGYHLSSNYASDGSYGVLGGLGLEGRAGAITGGVELGVGFLLLLAIANAISHGG